MTLGKNGGAGRFRTIRAAPDIAVGGEKGLGLGHAVERWALQGLALCFQGALKAHQGKTYAAIVGGVFPG